jgi:hypothetical protein
MTILHPDMRHAAIDVQCLAIIPYGYIPAFSVTSTIRARDQILGARAFVQYLYGVHDRFPSRHFTQAYEKRQNLADDAVRRAA